MSEIDIKILDEAVRGSALLKRCELLDGDEIFAQRRGLIECYSQAIRREYRRLLREYRVEQAVRSESTVPVET